jgi:hypothetical protein
MATVPNDLYTIPMDELRRLASEPTPDAPIDAAANLPVEPQLEAEGSLEQPRDENGRFVSREDAPPATEDEPQLIVRDEIDLGDGSGVQVFEGVGATEAEARADQVAKLLEAQRNATKKIKELSHRQPEPPAAPAGPSAEEEFLLGQRIINEPSAVIKELIKREFGMEPAEAKRRLDMAAQIEQGRAEEAAAAAFLAANPDFHVCPQNGNRIEKWLKINSLDRTQENAQKAYNELKADGLMVPKPSGEPAPTDRPRSSGLSTRRSAPAVNQKSEAELLREAYSMPLDKLREKIMYGR